MNVDNCLITDKKHSELCKLILTVLNCNVLWVINVNKGLLTVLASDAPILEHYWDKKYYLQDPNIPIGKHPLPVQSSLSPWEVHLGSHSNMFKQSGFLYDLSRLFGIEEFASIENGIGLESYCFRFFTQNNQFVFMNKLLNNMPFIKFFMNAMIERLDVSLRLQSGVLVCGPG